MAQHRAPRRPVGIWIAITVLLAASVIATLWVPFYNHLLPAFRDFPFFYWYQLMWVPIVAILSAAAYLLSRVARRGNADASRQFPDKARGRRTDMSGNAVALTIVIIMFAIVTMVGFAAARWRQAEDRLHLNEWGLGGRGFGIVITWFLLGGDIYTAYTFIAVPALVFGVGALGFFAVPYTIIVFPIVFVFAPRLWSVSRVHGYITPADFVRGRYGSHGLALAVAVTGILATMPYIALQLVGIQAVLTVLGVHGDWPLIIAFAVLAAYTWVSGLRAPALIAFIKDTLVYVMIIVAIFYIPARLGGWGHIFSTAGAHLAQTNPKTGKPFGSLTVGPTAVWAYSSLALGSALALFMYPHAVTGVLASRRRNAIRFNTAILPAYTLMLGFVALLGYMALAAPGVPAEVKAHGANAQLAVPFLFQKMFPPWFAGIAYSAIVIGALVPGGDHVDRGREPVHPQHLQGVLQAGRHPGPADQGRPVRLTGRQGGRTGVRARPEQDLLDQPAAAGRDLDPADLPGHRGGPVHPLVPPLGAGHRLGGGDGVRHPHRLQHPRTGRARLALRRAPRRTCPASITPCTSRSPRSLSTWWWQRG